jgi:hypothetical protein
MFRIYPFSREYFGIMDKENISLDLMELYARCGIIRRVPMLEDMYGSLLARVDDDLSVNISLDKWMQAALVCLLAVQMSPWLSPMKTAAGFSGPMVQISHGFLTLIGYVIPGIILIWMYKRSSAKAEAKLSKQA